VRRIGQKAFREDIICVNRSFRGNNIKIGCRNSDWLHDGFQCQTVVNTVMNLASVEVQTFFFFFLLCFLISVCFSG